MNISPYLLLTLTAFFWSLNFILGKVLSDTVPPATLTFLRWLLPSVFFLLLYSKEIKNRLALFKQHWFLILILGMTGYSLNALGVYLAVRYTTTINSAFINAFNPVLIAMCGFIMYRYPVTRDQALGFLLSFAGVLCIMFKGNLRHVAALQTNIGDLFMLGSIILFSIHTIVYKQKAHRFPEGAMFTAMMLGGLLSILPAAVVENIANHGSWVGKIRMVHVLCILCLNIFPSVLAYQFWHRALKHVSANQVAIFQYLIPVFTTGISILFLDEQLKLFHIVGGTLIFIGVFLVTSQKSARKASEILSS